MNYRDFTEPDNRNISLFVMYLTVHTNFCSTRTRLFLENDFEPTTTFTFLEFI